jgi:hypothetical protein
MSPPVDDDDLAKVRRLTGLTHLDASALCSTVQIIGAAAPLVGQSPRPALVFRFTHADGTELPPIVLVIDETEMCDLARAVHSEGHAAIVKARTIRGLS